MHRHYALAVNSADVLRFSLYAITVILGVVLALRVFRSRRLRLQESEILRSVDTGQRPAHSAPRIRMVRGMLPSISMADALAGIRLPVHWQPDPPVELRSPLTLTTNEETAGQMARILTDEFVRLGYRVSPTGARSACAKRGANSIAIEIDPGRPGSYVSSRLILTEASGV